MKSAMIQITKVTDRFIGCITATCIACISFLTWILKYLATVNVTGFTDFYLPQSKTSVDIVYIQLGSFSSPEPSEFLSISVVGVSFQ